MKFLDFIAESTKDIKRLADPAFADKVLSQKPLVDVRKWHEKAFGLDNHIEMDLPAEVPPKVVDHVSKHGGNIDDSGHKVTLKSGRIVDTSKFLGKSNAPKDINDEYQHHLRNASENGNTKLVISKHPGEVASCSTGTNWDSCARMDKDNEGAAANHLKHDIEHGTMIAMHVHKDAKRNSDGEYDAKDVLGRRLIKRHDTDTGKIVYHQEEKSYGQFPKSAIKKVEEFTDKHNTNDHTVAIKHDRLYDDDGKTSKIVGSATPDNIHKALDHKNETVREAAASHPNVSEDNIKKAINDESHEVVKSALANKSAPDSLLRHTINHARFANMAALAASNDNLSKDGILDALKHEQNYVGHDAINPNNPNFDSECLEKAINHSAGTRLLDKGFEDRIKPEHIDKFLDNKIGHIAGAAANHKNASSENLHKALSHESKFVRRAAVENDNASKEHLDKAMNDEDFKVRGAVLNHPKADQTHILKGLKDKHEDVVNVAKSVAEQRKIK